MAGRYALQTNLPFQAYTDLENTHQIPSHCPCTTRLNTSKLTQWPIAQLISMEPANMEFLKTDCSLQIDCL